MANYSINRLCVRGPRRSLALLQASTFEPSLGYSGDEHKSSWHVEDGQDMLLYSGSTRRHPPTQDVQDMSALHPDCLFELSFIDEGFCYAGILSVKAGSIWGEEELTDQERDEITAQVDEFTASEAGSAAVWAGPFDLAEAKHIQRFEELRAQHGWALAHETDEPFEAFMRALAADDPNASSLGANAGLDGAQCALLAILMDASQSVGPEARKALDSLEHAGYAGQLYPSVIAKSTPWGYVEGLKSFVTLHGAKAKGWIEGGWAEGGKDAKGLGLWPASGMLARALVGPTRRSEGSEMFDHAEVERRVERLFSSPNPKGLLYSGSSGLDAIDNRRMSLGEWVIFMGCSSWGGMSEANTACVEAYMKRALQLPEAAAWIDASYARLARESQEGEPRHTRIIAGQDDSILRHVLPAMSESTLELLSTSILVWDSGKALVEAELLERCSMSEPQRRAKARL